MCGWPAALVSHTPELLEKVSTNQRQKDTISTPKRQKYIALHVYPISGTRTEKTEQDVVDEARRKWPTVDIYY